MLVTNLAIVALLVLYAVLGYRRGFLLQLVELLILIGSLAVALGLYGPVSSVVAHLIPHSASLISLVIVLAIWFGAESLVSRLWRRHQHRLPADDHRHPTNRLVGLGPALLKGVVLVEILLLIIAAAPLPAGSKDQVLNASLARPFVTASAGLQTTFDHVFGKALRDVLALKTIKTEEEGSIDLGFRKPGAPVCSRDEERMLELLNKERTSRGLIPVTEDDALRSVGRDHSSDMLARGYFSHVTPDGIDPFQRMEKAGITYEYAGENLALAPTVDIAHTGLINSPGHRANILKPEYRKIGIGCVDGGLHGKMFSQEFTG